MTTQEHDGRTLSAIAPMREAGFALHWLHARQKRPIGKRWQDAAVATLDELRRTHQPGNNLGIRLGEPSLTPSGYVHLFDADIRIPELADEAWAAFDALFPGVRETLPTVISGSGGESRHQYFVTDKPFRSKLILHSDGKHRREVIDHDTGEVKEKWSYDWEIELYGTGKQVVLPPSIHPDTGKPYTWEREFDWFDLSIGLGPTIPSAAIEALGAADQSTFAFEDVPILTFKPGQLESDLDAIDVSELDYDDWVRLGQALHHQFGGSQEGFDLWLQHTKRSRKFIGDAQEREMRRIKWRSFGRYRGKPVTMATVRQWAMEARGAALRDAFDEEVEDDEDDTDDVDDMLGADAPPKAAAIDDLDEFTGGAASEKPVSDSEWTRLFDLSDEGAIKPTFPNVELILKNDPRFVGLAQINEFTQETVQRTPPGVKPGRKKAAKATRQLAGRIWQVKDTLNGELWSDDRDFAVRTIIESPKTQGGYGIKVTDRDLKGAIVLAANEHAFHPVREYLSKTTWDGVPRIERLWIDYVHAPDDAYHRSVARLMMVAAVARIFEPGHKFDFATILEGLQGKRKSTLIAVLGRSWFAELNGDWHDSKSMVELMQGAWIMEIPELTGFGRADVRAIKAFISTQKDRVRLAYARRAGQFPRQCIFIGSTNDREYLKDDTGGRRFWPVECRMAEDEEIDTDALEANVDQLWAEAVVVYQQMRAAKPSGTLPLYLADAESRVIAARLQESRRVESPDDVLAGTIAEWLDRPISNGGFDDDGQLRNETCSKEIWMEMLGGDERSFNAAAQSMVNRALMRVEGWGGDGSQKRFAKYGKQRVFYRGGIEGRYARLNMSDLL